MKIELCERRKDARVASSDRISFIVVPRAGCPELCRRESSGRTKDLSEGGTCFVSGVELPKGAQLQVRIVIMDPPGVYSHQGLVAWSKWSPEDGQWRTGIEFKWDSATRQREWTELIQTLRGGLLERVSAA